MAKFEVTVSLRTTVEAVFDFLARPANSVKISPPEASLQIIEAPDRFELGSRFEFLLGGFGPPQRILHEISHFEPPRRITETLVRGPLESWVHHHLIEDEGSGKVAVIDRVEFEPPGGFVGMLVTEEMILQSLETGFEHRHREIRKLLEQDSE
jgi:ligand-binding SRPBCC domain-containing protein